MKDRGKNVGQSEKSQKGYISPIWEEAPPLNRFQPKFAWCVMFTT